MSKNVMITGSNSGFGRLTTDLLLEKGYTVFGTMRGVTGKNAEAAKEMTEAAANKTGTLHIVELDVTDDASVEAAVKSVIDTAGQLDVVINNAGIGTFGVNEAFTIEQAEKVYDVNVFGVMRVNRAVLPHMREQKSGLLIHVSSGLGRFIFPFLGVYSSSKWALEGLVETYRYELAPLGVDALLVEPGAYGTSFAANILQGADQDRFVAYGQVAQMAQQMVQGMEERSQSGEMGDPQEVAEAIVGLIETPAGQRPLRTLVGSDIAILEQLNEYSTQMQAQLLEYMGMKELENVAPAE